MVFCELKKYQNIPAVSKYGETEWLAWIVSK